MSSPDARSVKPTPVEEFVAGVRTMYPPSCMRTTSFPPNVERSLKLAEGAPVGPEPRPVVVPLEAGSATVRVELGGIGGGATLLWGWGPELADMGIDDGGGMAEELGREAGRILADGLRERALRLADG